mgnify:CR=1 FL=1
MKDTLSRALQRGALISKEKDDEMLRFKKRDTQILMATTVIEVGVNVPNANVMIIVNYVLKWRGDICMGFWRGKLVHGMWRS